MALGHPTPFHEAIAPLQRRQIMPTSMTSAELRQLDQSVRDQSFYSAQTLLEDLLAKYKDQVETILNPQVGDRGVMEGLDLPTARLQIKNLLQELGYEPDEDKRGSIEDLSSDGRVDLVIDTNVELSQGIGSAIQGNDPAVRQAFPCWEYMRFENRKDPRDWPKRWIAAATAARDAKAILVFEQTGRMIARKDSGIWQALGDGAGGYDDTLGNPFPPFAFRTGMWWTEVPWDECKELGLVDDGDVIQPIKIDFSDAFGTDELEKAA